MSAWGNAVPSPVSDDLELSLLRGQPYAESTSCRLLINQVLESGVLTDVESQTCYHDAVQGNEYSEMTSCLETYGASEPMQQGFYCSSSSHEENIIQVHSGFLNQFWPYCHPEGSALCDSPRNPIRYIGITQVSSQVPLQHSSYHRYTRDKRHVQHYSSTQSSSMVPTTPDCKQCVDCGKNFLGKHAKGSLDRHRKRSCSSARIAILLSCLRCVRQFKRSDSLLKHERKAHPELGRSAPIRRKDRTRVQTLSGPRIRKRTSRTTITKGK